MWIKYPRIEWIKALGVCKWSFIRLIFWCVIQFQTKLRNYAKTGESIEIFSNLSLCTLDIILRCAFSYNDKIQEKGFVFNFGISRVGRFKSAWFKSLILITIKITWFLWTNHWLKSKRKKRIFFCKENY